MTRKKEHISYIDIAKGIAITAVVLGHCFPENFYSGDSAVLDSIAEWIYNFCYMWHMPVFFYLSGMLFFSTWVSKNYKKIALKAKRLLIPYFTFSLLYIPLRLFMSQYANSSYSGYWKILFGISPNGGVWFLYVLFVFMLITLFIIKNEKMLLSMTLLLSIANIAVNSGLNIEYSVLKYTLVFFFYWGMGILSEGCLKNLFEKVMSSKKGMVIIAILFSMIYLIRQIFNFLSINIVGGMLGIILVLYLSRRVPSEMLIGIIFSYFGRMSMSIYLFHGPILVAFRILLIRVNLPALMSSLILFLVGLLIPVVLDKYVLHLNQYIELVTLGIDNRKIKVREQE